MNFYKKKGRWTDEERAVIFQIKTLIEQNNIPTDSIRYCHTLDDLLTLKKLISETSNETTNIENQSIIEETVIEEKEKTELENTEVLDTDNSEEIEKIKEDESIKNEHPINEDIKADAEQIKEIESLDTQEENKNVLKEQTPPVESSEIIDQKEDIEEDITEKETDVFAEYDPFAEEIIERSYNKTEEKKVDSSKKMENLDTEDLNLEEANQTPVDKLNPATKRRAAEQTANALLKGYAKIVPIPFKWLAKIDESKVEKLAFDGQIDITIEVSEDMTFDDYMKQTNAQVDEIFEIEDDTLDEIREPLVEVLMEQELELTPQQRLGMAVFSHLIQMLTVALKLRKQNNRILEYQKNITGMNGLRAAS